MKFTYLCIKNFKQIRDLEITDFSRVNLIFGQNGSGKSSLIEALVLLLCNYTSVKLSECVNWDAQSFTISCKFIHQDKEFAYSIDSNLRGQTKRSLSVPGDKDYSNSEAFKYIKENILDDTLTLYSSVSLQQQGLTILFDTPLERLKKLKSIFKIGNIEIVSTRLKEDYTANNYKIISLKNTLKNLEGLVFPLQNLPEIEAINVKDLENKISILKENQKQNELRKEELYSLVSDCHIKLAGYQTEVKNYETKLLEKSRNDKLGEELQQERSSLSLRRKPVGEYTVQDIELLESDITSGQAVLIDLDKQLKLIKMGKCPTCATPISGSISEVESSKISQEEKLLVLKKKLCDCKAYFKEVDEVTLHNSFQEKKLSLIEQREKEVERIKQFYGDLIKPKDISKELEESILLYRQELDLLSANYMQEIETYQKKIFDYKMSLERYMAIEKSNELVKASQLENEICIKDKYKELAILNKETEILRETYDKISKNFSAYLINSGASYIKQVMNEFFMKAYNGRYSIEFSNDEKGIEFFYSNDNGSTIHSVELLSGYEKALFSISLRYALSSLQPHLGIIIADEIDSDSRSDTSLALYKTLLDQKDINQFFIITHKEGTQDYIYNLEGSKIFEINNGAIA